MTRKCTLNCVVHTSLAMILAFSASCDEESNDDRLVEDLTPSDDDSMVDSPEILAQVVIQDHGHVSFLDTSTSVAILEVGYGESLVAPMLEEGLSPLEIFEGLTDEQVPPELSEHPRARTGTRGSLTAEPDTQAASGAYASGSHCWQMNPTTWIDWIENEQYPGWEDYYHLTNNIYTGWNGPTPGRANYRATVCPIQSAGFGSGVGFLIQKRKYGSFSWKSVSYVEEVPVMARLWFWDLDNTTLQQWRTRMESVDGPTICDPENPWICAYGQDLYHFSHMWD